MEKVIPLRFNELNPNKSSTEKELDDGIEFSYFGARFYDPEMGVWISPDPARQFHSLYAYGPGNPVNGTDPDGEVWETSGVEVTNAGSSYLLGVTQNLDRGFFALVFGADSKYQYGLTRNVDQVWVPNLANPELDAQYMEANGFIEYGTSRTIEQTFRKPETANSNSSQNMSSPYNGPNSYNPPTPGQWDNGGKAVEAPNYTPSKNLNNAKETPLFEDDN